MWISFSIRASSKTVESHLFSLLKSCRQNLLFSISLPKAFKAFSGLLEAFKPGGPALGSKYIASMWLACEQHVAMSSPACGQHIGGMLLVFCQQVASPLPASS